MGLLASRSALAPILACITPAAAAAAAAAASPTPTPPQPSHDAAAAQQPQHAQQQPQHAQQQQVAQSLTAAAAASLCEAALPVLQRVACHAGCCDALAAEPTARLLFGLAAQPPSVAVLRGALGALRALAGRAAWGGGMPGVVAV